MRQRLPDEIRLKPAPPQMEWTLGDGVMRKSILLILLVALTGCTETIYMKNRATGEVAVCGDHSLAFPIYATIASTHDRECVQDYKDQGYARVGTKE